MPREMLALMGRMLRDGALRPRRLVGGLRNFVAAWRGAEPPRLPVAAVIDPSAVCQLHCPECPMHCRKQPSGAGLMDSGRFRGLIEELTDNAMFIALYNVGEPFMNPDCTEMIDVLTACRISSAVSTNGLCIADQESAERLVRSGLTVLIFSLSGSTQAVYEQYHRGGVLDDVLRAVRLVQAARRAHARATPYIKLRFLAGDRNRHDLPGMRNLAGSLDPDFVEFREMEPGRAPEATSPEAGEERGPSDRRGGRCLWPWLMTAVLWDGSVVPCCRNERDLPVFGNAFGEGGLAAVWHGAAYREFRRRMRAGRDGIECCRGCPGRIGYQQG